VATGDPTPAIGRRTRAAWLLFGGIFTGVVLTACGVASLLFMRGETEPMAEAQQQSYQHAVTRIELDITTGDVSLATGAAGQVSVDRRLEWSGTKPVLRESWEGDTLRIRSSCAEISRVPNLGRRCWTAYAVRVPADIAVEATVGQGTIRVKDVLGELRLSTNQGDVQIANAAKRMWVHSASGEITATGLRCTHAEARAYIGSVSLEFAAPPDLVKAATESGDVDIAVPRPAGGAEGYQVRTELEVGRSSIAVPQDPAARHMIFADVRRGNVYVRYTSA